MLQVRLYASSVMQRQSHDRVFSERLSVRTSLVGAHLGVTALVDLCSSFAWWAFLFCLVGRMQPPESGAAQPSANRAARNSRRGRFSTRRCFAHRLSKVLLTETGSRWRIRKQRKSRGGAEFQVERAAATRAAAAEKEAARAAMGKRKPKRGSPIRTRTLEFPIGGSVVTGMVILLPLDRG